MIKYIIAVFSIILLIFSACNGEKSIAERDLILDEAFKNIKSNENAVVIKGLETIKKYPTNNGLQKTIALWETDVSEKVEKEIISTLSSFETFMHDPSVIKEVVEKNYRSDASKSKKEKLKRLIESTAVDIKDSLIKKIDM